MNFHLTDFGTDNGIVSGRESFPLLVCLGRLATIPFAITGKIYEGRSFGHQLLRLADEPVQKQWPDQHKEHHEEHQHRYRHIANPR